MVEEKRGRNIQHQVIFNWIPQMNDLLSYPSWITLIPLKLPKMSWQNSDFPFKKLNLSALSNCNWKSSSNSGLVWSGIRCRIKVQFNQRDVNCCSSSLFYLIPTPSPLDISFHLISQLSSAAQDEKRWVNNKKRRTRQRCARGGWWWEMGRDSEGVRYTRLIHFIVQPVVVVAIQFAHHVVSSFPL